MRILIFSIATATAILTVPAFAVPLSCGPAVQNWQNGSGETCPYATGNAAISQPQPAIVVEEAPVEVAEETVD
jgi:hypothetical protein